MTWAYAIAMGVSGFWLSKVMRRELIVLQTKCISLHDAFISHAEVRLHSYTPVT